MSAVEDTKELHDTADILADEQTNNPDTGEAPLNNKIYQSIIGGVVLFAIAGGFLWMGGGSDKITSISVRLGWVHQGQFAGFYVAQEKGFYADAGLDVELLPLDFEIDQSQEIGRGDVEFSVMEAHQMLSAVSEGHPLKALAAIYQVNPHALAALSDSGISSPADFAGKRIGLAGGEGEGDSLFRVLIQEFVSLDSVHFIDLGFDTVSDFESDRADVIDIYSIDQPYLADQKGLDLIIISLDAYGFNTYGDVVVSRQEYIDNNPDVVRAFIQASMKGWEYALSNLEEAVSITLPYTSDPYTDQAYQRHIISQSIPLIYGNVSRIGAMELVPWSTLYESMRSVGAVSSEVVLRDVYTNDFIHK